MHPSTRARCRPPRVSRDFSSPLSPNVFAARLSNVAIWSIEADGQHAAALAVEFGVLHRKICMLLESARRPARSRAFRMRTPAVGEVYTSESDEEPTSSDLSSAVKGKQTRSCERTDGSSVFRGPACCAVAQPSERAHKVSEGRRRAPTAIGPRAHARFFSVAKQLRLSAEAIRERPSPRS